MIWTIVDGAIDGKAENGGQLVITKDDYDNFRFIVSSKDVSNTEHLGVCFWGGRKGFGYNGCMLVIPPGGGSWDYQKNGGLAGGMRFPNTFKQNEWHSTEILAHLATGTVEVATDGVKVFQWKDTNPARLKKGPIGLQIHAHASEVQYKDIFVDPDPKEDRLLTVKQP
jgi:hypothetical protein